MFLVGNIRLQGIDVSGDFRSHRIPISSGGIFGGLNVVIYLFGCCRRRSPRLFLARHDSGDQFNLSFPTFPRPLAAPVDLWRAAIADQSFPTPTVWRDQTQVRAPR
jgi:hypothetical protein